ncbi:hypothetical protein BT63DRAFT_427653 [Microthyrium microscopicum]|uniref:L domain-like protein n=1 Tax=Microthyrium microscopicum TaxID=703497 RepID=A0A6A6U3L8_9PEZI|nr:hypothetical protein BT63DRAFT_427653 [Microthyrium microscopicum]
MADSDLPSSPPLPTSRLDRKRRFDHLHDVSGFSSDPPVFSSDPPEVSLDSDRRKRIYSGAWWGAPDQPNDKTDLARNFDSGVFMSSDQHAPIKDHVIPSRAFRRVASVSTPLSRAQDIVNEALEKGDDIVDLSDLDLVELPNSIAKDLDSLVKVPRFFNESQSPIEQEFQPLAPKIQLYLANNLLPALPPALWSLDNLTVLSVRNNNLRSIPASISKLSNLTELNLANNSLRSLPWEILRLLGPGKALRTMHLRPNPLFIGIDAHAPPMDRTHHIPPESGMYKLRLKELKSESEISSGGQGSHPSRWLCKLLERVWQALREADPQLLSATGPQCLWTEPDKFGPLCVHIASTRVWYLNSDGTPIMGVKGTMPSKASASVTHFEADPYAPVESPRSSSSTPSLLELCMAQCAASPYLDQIQSLLPSETPIPVVRALEETYGSVKEGGRVCSVCSRHYQIPRAEWIEYWHCMPKGSSAMGSEENFWPLLRRGCSWACVPVQSTGK